MNPEIAGLLSDDDESFEETLEIMKDDLEETGYFIMRSQCAGCIYRNPKSEKKPITNNINNIHPQPEHCLNSSNGKL